MWKSLSVLNALWLIICALWGGRMYAQTPNLEILTAADGLSQGMVFDLLQDRRGFLWFATKDGLNRYDGYNFRVYHNDPFNPFSLVENEIQDLFEDHLGRLWIGTKGNGVDVFDPSTDRFYHLNKLVDQDVSCFAETPDGSVWVGTGKGISRVKLPDVLPAAQPDLQSVAQVDNPRRTDGSDSDPLSSSANFLADLQGQLWISTEQQVGRYDPATGHLQTVFNDFKHLSRDGEQFVPTLVLGPDSSIWVAHPDQLLHIRPGGIDAFPLPERSLFPQTELVFDATGNLFVSTRKQIFTLSAAAIQTPKTARFELFYRFPNEGIIGTTKLLMDRGGLLWIGTNGYGLRKYNPGDRHFRHFAPGISLRRIANDAQGRTWAWRSGTKFFRLDETEGRLVDPLLPDEPNLLQHDLLADRNGALWLLCEDKNAPRRSNGVLIKLHPQTLRPEARFPFSARISILSQFIEDRAGHLRIIGGESTLSTFDPASGTFTTLDFSGATGYQEAAYSLQEDAAGQYWIGTPHGLLRGEAGGNGLTFSVLKNNPADRQSLNCDVVLATLDDLREPRRYLWVATKGGGLNRLDKTTGQFQHFTTADGLPNNVVYSILPDSTGALWLSTNCGLAKFDPHSSRFQNFFVADGLQDNEFNTVSFARGADGRLFFGGVNGMTAFYPQALAAATTAPPVFLTALKIQNHPLAPGDGILEKSLEETTAITLLHDQNQLTFEFAGMDFSAPQQNQYRYRLVGADRDWVEPTTANSATYTNLAPGHYEFEVVSGGSHGVWNGQPVRLQIDILPPWWRTNWAYLLYFLVVSAGGWTFYRFQINKLELKNKLEFEQREAERLVELDRLKSNFFSSVTHEFRTPLTLLLEPARQLLHEAQDRSVRYRLELIEKSARRLLRFVNQLLDLSKLEAGQMPLDLRPDSPVATLRSVAETFEPLAAQRAIRLELQLPAEAALFLFDRDKLEQVISNLLSNALKFTGKEGMVTAKLDFPPDQIVLQVADTGSGIPEAAQALVFNRFYQVGDHAVQGTGIGLALTKELVERMGGNIAVESAVDRGTTFTVTLPASVADQLPVAAPAPPVIDAPAVLPTPATAKKAAGEGVADHTPAALPVEKHPLLLLVEDNHDLRRFLRSSLPSEYRIAEAADGAEGIRMALELIPDLVVSDVMMPEKDGFELCEALKHDPRSSHIPIILLTAKSTVESKIQGLRQGADAYLTKPFRADELIAQIENLIALRQRLQGIFSKTVSQQTVTASAEKVFEPRENEFLQKLIQVVEENLDNEAMDAETFARSIYMSRSQLHRKISALTGLPLTEFVRNYRLDRARDMLRQQEGSITEVAWRTGFPNAKYFSTCFRERFGQSPSLFRSGGVA